MKYPSHLKVQNQNKPEVEVNLKENLRNKENPPKAQEADEIYMYDSPNNYYHNDNYTAPSHNQGCRPFNGQGGNQQHSGFTQRNRGQRPQYNQRQFQNY